MYRRHCYCSEVSNTLEINQHRQPLKKIRIRGIYRKSTLNIHRKDWCWSWSSNTMAPWGEELTHWKRPWWWERLRAGGERGDRWWESTCQCRRHGFNPWSQNIPHAAVQLSLCTTSSETHMLWSPCSNQRGQCNEKPVHAKEEQPLLSTTRESPFAATKIQSSQKKKKKFNPTHGILCV